MRLIAKATVAGFALLAAGTFVAMPPAVAQGVSVQVGVPGVAFGYTDGYWDQQHQWHAWKDSHEAQAWREEHHDHYYAYKHDRDPNQGWRNDTWWDHH